MEGIIKEMTTPPGLGREVATILLRHHAYQWLRVSDVDASSAQRGNLVGIVRQQPHSVVSEKKQHASGEVIAPFVGTVSEQCIGVDCVEAGVLQSIGSHLVADSCAAPLLIEIKQNATARCCQIGNRPAQLVAAIASQRAEQVASQAGRMEANGDGIRRIGMADDNSHLITQRRPTTEDYKLGFDITGERNLR